MGKNDPTPMDRDAAQRDPEGPTAQSGFDERAEAAAERISDAAQRDPEGPTAQSGFDERAEAAAERNDTDPDED